MRAIVVSVVVAAALASPVGSSARSRACLAGPQQATLVFYGRTGGFVGLNERLTVRRSGAATLVRVRPPDGSFRLSCTRVRALAAALEAARFPSLAPLYAPDEPFADGLVETVSYRGRTVRVLTGAEPPRRLARVLAILRSIVATRR